MTTKTTTMGDFLKLIANFHDSPAQCSYMYIAHMPLTWGYKPNTSTAEVMTFLEVM